MTAPCVRVPTGLFCVCGLARSQPSVFLILCFLNGTHPGHRLPRANVTGASEAGYTQRCNPYPVAEKSGLVANLAVPLTAAPPVAVRVDKSGRGMAALAVVVAAVPVLDCGGRGSEVNVVAVRTVAMLSLVRRHDSRTEGTVVSAAGMAHDPRADAPRMVPVAGCTSDSDIDFGCAGDVGARRI